jgi:mannitol/fructose-specific phosphotransferase system IIA component (Ntr-type)
MRRTYKFLSLIVICILSLTSISQASQIDKLAKNTEKEMYIKILSNDNSWSEKLNKSISTQKGVELFAINYETKILTIVINSKEISKKVIFRMLADLKLEFKQITEKEYKQSLKKEEKRKITITIKYEHSTRENIKRIKYEEGVKVIGVQELDDILFVVFDPSIISTEKLLEILKQDGLKFKIISKKTERVKK